MLLSSSPKHFLQNCDQRHFLQFNTQRVFRLEIANFLDTSFVICTLSFCPSPLPYSVAQHYTPLPM
jgi:hypothetical protein